MNRRSMMEVAAVFAAGTMLPTSLQANELFAPRTGSWRRFQVVTRIELTTPMGRSQAWIPLPSVDESEWFQSNGNTWRTNGRASVHVDATSKAQMLHVQWDDREQSPIVEVTSDIATRDRMIDLTRPSAMQSLSSAERRYWLAGTDLIPVDGIVKETSAQIVANARSDIEKARAIYDWIVENSYRRADTRGCGTGDVTAMLKSGNLGGKCADLNALFVGLARAAEIPSRDIYGLRVAPSRFGYMSLGANSANVTKAQHCRAEVFLDYFGWVPVDPADVRKVMLEEPPGNLPTSNPKVADVRQALFGSWETNWLAYNFAHDLSLPGSQGPKVGFLMYPQAETDDLRFDSLDPENFRYSIRAKEVSAI
ncbi:transglutaminase-like domain-containing protein [Bradyrhizobium liaoningense]|uniref:transglutaminase-like domain-containing protein n=1 Tax=Bradyrhizobium liaoningense TaxID=43992 RepID=UPI003D9B2F66